VAFTIRSVEYYYANVRDELGAAYRFLSQLAEFGGRPPGVHGRAERASPRTVHLVPTDTRKLIAQAKVAGLPLDGPYHAFLVQGDDELGALANVHEQLVQAGVDIFASSGVSDGRGAFGYLVYVREDQFEKAAAALNI
jgi:hypothetical protein